MEFLEKAWTVGVCDVSKCVHPWQAQNGTIKQLLESLYLNENMCLYNERRNYEDFLQVQME